MRTISGLLIFVVVAVATAVPVGADVRRAPAPSAWLRWPLPPPIHLVRGFAPPPEPWVPGHRGVDLAAPAGTPVFAAGAGVVRYAGPLAGRGVLSIEHAGGLRTSYEPVEATVPVGRWVPAGAVIGVLAAGHPGCPGAESGCLHWGARLGDSYLDPTALVGPVTLRLKPLAG